MTTDTALSTPNQLWYGYLDESGYRIFEGKVVAEEVVTRQLW